MLFNCLPLEPSVKSPTLPNICMNSMCMLQASHVYVVCVIQGRTEFLVWTDV